MVKNIKKRKWGKRLTKLENKNLYSWLGFNNKFDLLPEKWQEVLELLAIGTTYKEIAKTRKVTLQAIQNQRVNAIHRLGYRLFENEMTIRDLYLQVKKDYSNL